MIAAERLGFPLEQGHGRQGRHRRGPAGDRHVRLEVDADRRRRPPKAADAVVEKAQQLAADYLEAALDDIVLDRGAGASTSPARLDPLSWAQLATRRATDGRLGELRRRRASSSAAPDVPVRRPRRRRRGRHRDGRGRAACGSSPSTTRARIVNPLLAEGQVHGGLARVSAQALLEEVVYDEDGNPLTATFADYALPVAADLPSLRDGPHGDADAASTRSARRASASRARSAPRRPSRTRSSTRSPTSGSATSTCPATARTSGGRCRRRSA